MVESSFDPGKLACSAQRRQMCAARCGAPAIRQVLRRRCRCPRESVQTPGIVARSAGDGTPRKGSRLAVEGVVLHLPYAVICLHDQGRISQVFMGSDSVQAGHQEVAGLGPVLGHVALAQRKHHGTAVCDDRGGLQVRTVEAVEVLGFRVEPYVGWC